MNWWRQHVLLQFFHNCHPKPARGLKNNREKKLCLVSAAIDRGMEPLFFFFRLAWLCSLAHYLLPLVVRQVHEMTTVSDSPPGNKAFCNWKIITWTFCVSLALKKKTESPVTSLYLETLSQHSDRQNSFTTAH